MIKYIIRRLLISIPVLIGITIITFAAYNLAPGDPISAMIDPSAPLPAETITQIENGAGAQPAGAGALRLIWLRELARGNLGFSFASRRPVSQVILARLPATLQLTVASLHHRPGSGHPSGRLFGPAPVLQAGLCADPVFLLHGVCSCLLLRAGRPSTSSRSSLTFSPCKG